MPAKINVASVEQDGSDGLKITLLGYVAGGPQVREFKGLGLKQIDTLLLDEGIHVVAWIVDHVLSSQRGDTDLPLIERPSDLDDRFGNAAVLAKIKPGEPFFVLRGQDKMAPMAVRHWANEAEKAGVDPDKVQNARNCAHAMNKHRPIKMPD